MSAEPDVCPEPTPVAQNDYFFQRAPTKSAKGCCRRELLRNHKRGILQSDSIVLPVYILVLGGGRFRPFLPIVLELFYPSTYFFGSGRFRPFVYYVVLESKPIIIDLLRTAWGGWKIYTLCVCTDQIRYCTFLHIASGVWQNFTCCYAICTEAEETCENGGKRLGEP